jgi:hypothetical protein
MKKRRSASRAHRPEALHPEELRRDERVGAVADHASLTSKRKEKQVRAS